MIYAWLTESVFLLVVAVYVAAILAVAARRSRVAPATLAVGTGAGIVLGAVMYAVARLGFTDHPTDPWLHGLPVGLVVLLAWVLLFGGPVLAGVVAARCYRGPGSLEEVSKARVRQAVAAGFLATAVGALMVTVAGTVTVALMPRAGWVLAFPVIGLVMGLAGNPRPWAVLMPGDLLRRSRALDQGGTASGAPADLPRLFVTACGTTAPPSSSLSMRWGSKTGSFLIWQFMTAQVNGFGKEPVLVPVFGKAGDAAALISRDGVWELLPTVAQQTQCGMLVSRRCPPRQVTTATRSPSARCPGPGCTGRARGSTLRSCACTFSRRKPWTRS
jgi:hypothetical protein